MVMTRQPSHVIQSRDAEGGYCSVEVSCFHVAKVVSKEAKFQVVEYFMMGLRFGSKVYYTFEVVKSRVWKTGAV